MGILLLHGLGGDRRQPLSLLQPVLPTNASLLAPDIRAHGGSPLFGPPGAFSFGKLTTELGQQVHDAGLGMQPLTIIGISLGAALSLRLALSGKFAVDRLILLRPAFTDESLPQNLRAFPVMGELLHRHAPPAAAAAFRRTGIYRDLERVSPLGAAGALQQFRDPHARERAIRLVELPRNRAFTNAGDLTGVTAQVTVVAAPRDPVHPLAVAELWHDALPGSRLTVLPARDDGLKDYITATRQAVAAAFG
ncbi:MAG: hypothetical protein JWP30_2113 [Homoserinimonas sp.]|jgi:pimeloyl-ACP methyl ester carboxylesterase|nr:hypothetical protein [Homoserinimonas sp.]